MGKASRQHRLKKDRERQRRRAQHGGTPSGAGPRNAQPSVEELISLAVGLALDALEDDGTTAFAEVVHGLASHPRPGWTDTVSKQLVGYLRRSVTAAWQAGWQPAELVRHLDREAGEPAAQMATDMIADEMRTYAVATVDDRWAAQLKLLGAQVWWGSDARYTSDWCERFESDLQSVLTTAMRVLFVFQHLVKLPRLGPLPGEALPRTIRQTRDPAEATDERMLGKIRALLAKAESTEFAEEAEALSARAQELMAKYSIDHALLAAATGAKDKPASRRVPVDNPYESPKVSLLAAVAKANRCQTVWYKSLGMTAVIGFAADLDAVELLFTSLLVQANTAMLRAGAKRDQFGRSRTRAFRQSFLVAYAIRIGERLSGTAEHVEQEAVAASPGQNLLPVLAARHQAVDDTVSEMFGNDLTYHRSGRATDSEGWYSGRAAADLAALHGHREVSAESA